MRHRPDRDPREIGDFLDRGQPYISFSRIFRASIFIGPVVLWS